SFVDQKTAFIDDLKTSSTEKKGISRVKTGAASAFSEIIKKEKEPKFWRVIYPDIKDSLPEKDFTLDDTLEMKFSNIKGGKLTQKDDFVIEIVQTSIDNLIDEGILENRKREGNAVYQRVKNQE
ncbi:MAG TPA: hypothetical protein VMV49_13615, partial [Candidatus Deferrimicrobium sp.]|nr:hypothetical protein [Candidatus Deferrimicrobium sp.]